MIKKHWLAEHFIIDEALTVVALSLVRDAGGRIGPTRPTRQLNGSTTRWWHRDGQRIDRRPCCCSTI